MQRREERWTKGPVGSFGENSCGVFIVFYCACLVLNPVPSLTEAETAELSCTSLLPCGLKRPRRAPSCRRQELRSPSGCPRPPGLFGWCFCVFSGLLTQRCPGCWGSSLVTLRLFIFYGPLGANSALALHETHVCARVSECECVGGDTEAHRRLLHEETSVFSPASRVSDVLLQGSHFFK